MSDLLNLEQQVPGATPPHVKRIEDEAMESYLPELNQRMGSLNTLAQSAYEDMDNVNFLSVQHQKDMLSPSTVQHQQQQGDLNQSYRMSNLYRISNHI